MTEQKQCASWRLLVLAIRECSNRSTEDWSHSTGPRAVDRGKRQAGFTLIEVLVALGIFAVIGVSIVKTMQDSVRHQIAIEERLAANWLAQQTLAELRLRTPWPPLGEKTEQLSFAGREWQVTARVEATTEQRMRHITIEVAHPDTESSILTLDAWAAEEK